MRPRVTAILVARNGERYLPRTLDALREQHRPPDAIVAVDAGSTDATAQLIGDANATVVVSAGAVSLADAIAAGLRAIPPTSSADQWIWLLTADTAPHPEALEELLAAVEVAPSVAIAGPKLVHPDDAADLASFGVSVSGLGRTVPLVEGGLDQGQYDRDDDVLGVSVSGALVRRTVWDSIGGLDQGLPSADSGLDLSVRARLAGYRVIRVPDARISRARRLEDYGRRRAASPRRRGRIARSAQLHRRFVYAPAAALPLHWISLVPLAVIRSIGHLLAKRPTAVPGEFSAAFRAAFADRTVGPARRRLARTRSMGWSAIAPLRVPRDEIRRRAVTARDRAAEGRAVEAPLVRAEFFAGGGIWIVVLAGLVGLAEFWHLIGASALTGGAALPLSATVPELWHNAILGWRDLGAGSAGPADPFTSVLAVFGSITFFSPSASLVVLWLAAMPLAALGAWWCATRLSERAWPPAVAALLYALAPPLQSSLASGRVASVVGILVLPWLVLAAIEARRSWSAAANASILFAVEAASSPSLAPALLVLWLIWVILHPRSVLRLIGFPIPAMVLFAPLVIAEVARGKPLALLADPGVALPFAAPSGWGLVAAGSQAGAQGWDALLGSDAGVASGGLITAVLLIPIALLAVLGLFVPGSRRALAALAVALLGLVTAAVVVRIRLTATGDSTVAVWPATALGMYWAGLVGAAVVGLRGLRRAALLAGLLALVCVAGMTVPSVIAGARGTALVRPSDGQTLPALVGAQAVLEPGVGSMVLTPLDDGTLSAALQRGGGARLDQVQTIDLTRTSLTDGDRTFARLAGNVASRSGLDPRPGLARYGVAFIVLNEPADGKASAPVQELQARVIDALDSDASLESVGDSTTGDALWRVVGAPRASTSTAMPTALRSTLVSIEALVFAVALLLAIPTRRRRRVVSTEVDFDDPATTFGDETDE